MTAIPRHQIRIRDPRDESDKTIGSNKIGRSRGVWRRAIDKKITKLLQTQLQTGEREQVPSPRPEKWIQLEKANGSPYTDDLFRIFRAFLARPVVYEVKQTKDGL